jgi:hypothetical protein
MAANDNERLIRELVDTYIHHPEGLGYIPTTEQRREIHRGVRDRVEGNPDQHLGGFYERGYIFADNSLNGEALTPRRLYDQQQFDELVPYTSEDQGPPTTDFKRGGFVKRNHYRIGRMK